MSKQSEKLYDGITNIGDELTENAFFPRKKGSLFKLKHFIAPVAAVLALAVLLVFILKRGGSTPYTPFTVLAEAVYPEQGKVNKKSDYISGAQGFIEASLPAILRDADGGNTVYSPLNLYLTLGMLAEITGGTDRESVLSALGADSIELQRERSNALWNANYYNNDRGASLLASSVWLTASAGEHKTEALDRLASSYYASSFCGDPDSDEYLSAFKNWLNENTHGIIDDSLASARLGSAITIASTAYFRGQWKNCFNEQETQPADFHAPSGDVTCDFMSEGIDARVYNGAKFSALRKAFSAGGAMWFILPNEGITPKTLTNDRELAEFISMSEKEKLENAKTQDLSTVLFVPKFDISYSLDLAGALEALGIDMPTDFSAVFKQAQDDSASGKHSARVMIDERGCIGTAYTYSTVDRLIDSEFRLDRPFMFAVTARDGLPLFVGTVNDPSAK